MCMIIINVATSITKPTKMLRIIPLFFLFSICCVRAQDVQVYSALVAEAEQLTASKSYEEASAKYQAAFDELDGKAGVDHRYDAARVFALAGEDEKALFHIKYLAEHPRIQFSDLDKIKSDKAFNSYQNNEDWAAVVALVKANKISFEKDLDKPLAARLKEILEKDQKLRNQFLELERKHGVNSEETKKLWGPIAQADAENLKEITDILDSRGWLGPKVVGKDGSKAIFLVIQHADIAIQEKYLPMMRDAVAKGDAQPHDLALLEDRVAVRNGRKQIYGSQIGIDSSTNTYYVEPIMDPDKVDERRKAVGLNTLAMYLTNFGIKWDLEAHKARSKKMEEKK